MSVGVASDSLPADGQSAVELAKSPNRSDDQCKVKVTYVQGDVRGVRMDTVIITMCERDKDTVITMREVDLAVNNVLTPPTHITTGNNSRAEITMPDGSIIRVGPNSDIEVEDALCKPGTEDRDRIKETMGEIWAATTHALGGDNVIIESGNGMGSPRGTIFSFESMTVGDDTVVTERTYEGEVVVTKTNGTDKTLTSAEDQIKQIQEDYKNGKITMQEYQDKAMQISKDAYNYNKSANTVTVEAGYQSVVKREGPPSTPEKFDPDPNAWFVDSNFGK